MLMWLLLGNPTMATEQEKRRGVRLPAPPFLPCVPLQPPAWLRETFHRFSLARQAFFPPSFLSRANLDGSARAPHSTRFNNLSRALIDIIASNI